MRCLGTLLTLAAALGCTTPAEEALEVQHRLIGLDEHHIRLCLGEPNETVLADDREIWYR